MSEQWEGKRRGPGRPSRCPEPASINLVIRVTQAEKLRLIAWAEENRAESLADFCRLILNEAAEDDGRLPPLHAA